MSDDFFGLIGRAISTRGVELSELRNRWASGKYLSIREAIESVLPQEKWMDLCDELVHPGDGKLANDLRGMVLCGKNLKDVDLGSSFLDCSIFDGCVFDGAQFQWSIMKGASFKECKFLSSQLIVVFGDDANFSGADFDRTYINEARMERVNFSFAAMRGGMFSNSNARGGDLSHVQMMGVKVKWNDFRDCNLSGARFVDCDFSASNIAAGSLVDAYFENCNLSGVDLRGANLSGVRFQGGVFGDIHQGSAVYRTRFDDTPEVRRAVASSGAESQDCIEWSALAPKMREPNTSPAPRIKAMPGEVVPTSGWWTCPALGSKDGRQYFKAGERFPETKVTDWGQIIWSYDPSNQRPD